MRSYIDRSLKYQLAGAISSDKVYVLLAYIPTKIRNAFRLICKTASNAELFAICGCLPVLGSWELSAWLDSVSKRPFEQMKLGGALIEPSINNFSCYRLVIPLYEYVELKWAEYLTLPTFFKKNVLPNAPCPLAYLNKNLNIVEHGSYPTHKIVRICQAPIDNQVDLTYLKYVDLAMQLGAWKAIKAKCAFCYCCDCCGCEHSHYHMRDAEREMKRRDDMRAFDKRVKIDNVDMKIMYDKI